MEKRLKKNLAVIGVGIMAGGSGLGIPAMVKGLIKLQELYTITFYSLIPIDRENTPKGIRVRCISTRTITLKIKYLYLGILFLKDHLLNSYSLIHAQSPYPAGAFCIWINKLFRIPWVLSLHAGETAHLPEVNFGDLLNPHLKKVAIEACNKADLIMTLSQFQADITRHNLKLEREVHVLHRGVDVVNPLHTKRLSPPFQFLHISNYHPVKDYATLLKTFASISKHLPAKLIIAGSNYPVEVAQLIASLELEEKVTLIGAIPHEEIDSLFDASDVLLHTSRFEGLPMVALEAMARGVLVCGTHVGIMADLSMNYCITVPTGNDEALARAVVDVLHNEQRYNEIRARAYLYAREHDLQWYVTELDAIYAKIRR